MLLTTNKRKRTTIAIFIALAILLLAIIILALWRLRQPAAQPATSQSSDTSTEQAAPTKDVLLPNADPVTLIDEDYTADNSLWRLVNKSHPLSDPHYRPANLQLASVTSRTDKSTDERSLRADIMPAVEELFDAAETAGYSLQIGSGFRGYDLQNTYYTNYVAVYGQAAADTFSAKPGYSEHQTGLAMDVATLDNDCYLEECFGETPAGMWLAAHAHEYGFILRYPPDGGDVTDFHYEPWHFRYVGVALASAIHQSGLTFDEAYSYIEKAME